MAIVEVFSLDAVRVNLAYLDQLKRLFTDYIHRNLNEGKKVVSWRDVEEAKDPPVTMCATSFLKLCRYHQLIPHLFNIEALEQFIEQTLPAITQGEHEFYEKHMLIDAYNKDKDYQRTLVEPMQDEKGQPCEPSLHFHEFVFLLGLIARKCIVSNDSSMQGQLTEFYEEKLRF